MIENRGFREAGREEVCRQVGEAGRAKTPRVAHGPPKSEINNQCLYFFEFLKIANAVT